MTSAPLVCPSMEQPTLSPLDCTHAEVALMAALLARWGEAVADVHVLVDRKISEPPAVASVDKS
jgi:hypothetical protein